MLIIVAVKKRNRKMNHKMKIFLVIRKIYRMSMRRRMKRKMEVKILSWELFLKMRSTILKMMTWLRKSLLKNLGNKKLLIMMDLQVMKISQNFSIKLLMKKFNKKKKVSFWKKGHSKKEALVGEKIKDQNHFSFLRTQKHMVKNLVIMIQ